MKSTTPSTIDPAGEPADDPALFGAVQEYLSLLESGKAPDRREFVRRFPDVADALDKCLAGLEAVHGAAGPKTHKGPTIDPQLSKPLGDFQIHREIGRGGMGIVYEATQLSLGRKVALKVLPFAATFDAKHLQRFRNEAQAAAQLHHTNIVPVFAVGCERGVHFYAMQLIEGQSLSVLIDQFRDRAGMRRRIHVGGNPEATATMQASPPASSSGIAAETDPSGSFPAPLASATVHSVTLSSQHSKSRKDYFRSVARLFVQAALGLDHAHQVGIVHRDIKPANLLVDGRGNLWIADFGLAQFRSEAHLTKTGDLVGTLRYMSPEQASGQRAVFDHRCDVYSLGATLYEMATLEPIFVDQDSVALLRKISQDEPIPPRTIDPAIPIELETIILKAVSKAPSERYATAQEMASDLQRYLDDQPILARRPSSIDRVRKWSRRHPSVVASGVGFLIFCLVGLSVNNWLLAREQDKTRKEEEKTRRALDGEKKRGDDAERNLVQLRRSVELLIQVAEEEFAANRQLHSARKKVLQTALTFYKDLIEKRGDDPESQAALERDQERVQQILSDLAIYDGAQRLELLADKSVHDDLKLSPREQVRAERFAQDLSEKRLAIITGEKTRSLPFDQQQQLLVALIRERTNELGELLTKAQLDRLGQIELQSKGVFAFEDQDIVAELKLDPTQRAKVREIHASIYMFDDGFKKKIGKDFGKEPDRMDFKDFGKGPPFGKGKGGKGPFGGEKGFGPFRGHEEAHRNGVNNIVKNVLSEEQRERWRELVGEPFVGSVRMPHFGPMPPPKGKMGPP